MPYPGQFHRLVMIGTHYTEQFNMTLNIVPSALGELGMPQVDDATLAAVAGKVSLWFGKTTGFGGNGFFGVSKLVSIKLNRIGTTGHYVDPIAKEHIYPAPVPGAAPGNPFPQLALVATLGTALERGRASKGRVYLLPNQSMPGVGNDGRITQAQASGAAADFKVLVNDLNATYSLIGKVGVASAAGAGRFEHVTRISVGRVVDTMRSRRSSLLEDHQEVSL